MGRGTWWLGSSQLKRGGLETNGGGFFLKKFVWEGSKCLKVTLGGGDYRLGKGAKKKKKLVLSLKIQNQNQGFQNPRFCGGRAHRSTRPSVRGPVPSTAPAEAGMMSSSQPRAPCTAAPMFWPHGCDRAERAPML